MVTGITIIQVVCLKIVYRMGPQFGIAKLVQRTNNSVWYLAYLNGVINQLITGGASSCTQNKDCHLSPDSGWFCMIGMPIDQPVFDGKTGYGFQLAQLLIQSILHPIYPLHIPIKSHNIVKFACLRWLRLSPHKMMGYPPVVKRGHKQSL